MVDWFKLFVQRRYYYKLIHDEVFGNINTFYITWKVVFCNWHHQFRISTQRLLQSPLKLNTTTDWSLSIYNLEINWQIFQNKTKQKKETNTSPSEKWKQILILFRRFVFRQTYQTNFTNRGLNKIDHNLQRVFPNVFSSIDFTLTEIRFYGVIDVKSTLVQEGAVFVPKCPIVSHSSSNSDSDFAVYWAKLQNDSTTKMNVGDDLLDLCCLYRSCITDRPKCVRCRKVPYVFSMTHIYAEYLIRWRHNLIYLNVT